MVYITDNLCMQHVHCQSGKTNAVSYSPSLSHKSDTPSCKATTLIAKKCSCNIDICVSLCLHNPVREDVHKHMHAPTYLTTCPLSILSSIHSLGSLLIYLSAQRSILMSTDRWIYLLVLSVRLAIYGSYLRKLCSYPSTSAARRQKKYTEHTRPRFQALRGIQDCLNSVTFRTSKLTGDAFQTLLLFPFVKFGIL